MERLMNFDEYKALLIKYKRICRRGFTNNYLPPTAVKRYIGLGRIYYEADDASLQFFTDEEKYFRLYLQTAADGDIVIRKAEKPLLVRNIYKKGEKPEALQALERRLDTLGFLLYDQTVQILANPLELEAEIRPKCERALSLLRRFGITIGYAKQNHIAEILALRDSEALLKDYHFSYESQQEIYDNIEKECYRCAFDAEGNICAAQQFVYANDALEGDWLAVKEEYKSKYGIGAAIAYHSLVCAAEKGIKSFFSWVASDNEQSLKYHESLGYALTGKCADEWVLQASADI